MFLAFLVAFICSHVYAAAPFPPDVLQHIPLKQVPRIGYEPGTRPYSLDYTDITLWACITKDDMLCIGSSDNEDVTLTIENAMRVVVLKQLLSLSQNKVEYISLSTIEEGEYTIYIRSNDMVLKGIFQWNTKREEQDNNK